MRNTIASLLRNLAERLAPEIGYSPLGRLDRIAIRIDTSNVARRTTIITRQRREPMAFEKIAPQMAVIKEAIRQRLFSSDGADQQEYRRRTA